MKVLLDIQDSMAIHLMEILKSLPYVKTETISEDKSLIIKQLKTGIDELNQIKKGKLTGITIKDLLNDL